MPEERLSDGEIRRTFERLDRDCRERTAAVDRDSRERTQAVADTVKDLKTASRLTVGRVLAILTILATLLAGWWAAIGAAKGIH